MSDWMANPPKSASEQWGLVNSGPAVQTDAPAPEIATQAEKAQLEAQRDIPKLERHYRPDGMSDPVPDAAAQQREARIMEINASLQKAKTGFEKEFDKASD